MRSWHSWIRRGAICALVFSFSAGIRAAPTQDEELAMARLVAKGFEITRNRDGQAERLMLKNGKDLTAEDYAPIGRLPSLVQIGINGSRLEDGEWGFLKQLPNLRQLSIWHGTGFASLEPFSGLPVESLTIGGCLGLREKNRHSADKLRHAITTLHDLPNLRKGNWYHSPLAPDDAHLAHIVKHFPKLEELRLDFAAPAGTSTTITSQGLASLAQLPLHTLSLENVSSFGDEHFKAIAGIRTLRSLLIDARRNEVSAAGIELFRQARPEVEVVVADAGAKGPPTSRRKP